jgi:hypothetical protein
VPLYYVVVPQKNGTYFGALAPQKQEETREYPGKQEMQKLA